MNALCEPLGPGYATAADSTGAEMVKIVQTPVLIVILNPDLTYRQIFMDGRPLETAPNPDWMGYSVGHWDGDTLVVDSFGFNDRTWLDHDGHPHTEALRTTERYRRRNLGPSGPRCYAFRSHRVCQAVDRRGARGTGLDTEMLEWVCDSNNRVHWVGRASDETKNEPKIAPETLAKYVGTFVEQPRFWRSAARTLEVSLSNGRLYGQRYGRARQSAAGRSLGSRILRLVWTQRRVRKERRRSRAAAFREARVGELSVRAGRSGWPARVRPPDASDLDRQVRGAGA